MSSRSGLVIAILGAGQCGRLYGKKMNARSEKLCQVWWQSRPSSIVGVSGDEDTWLTCLGGHNNSFADERTDVLVDPQTLPNKLNLDIRIFGESS